MLSHSLIFQVFILFFLFNLYCVAQMKILKQNSFWKISHQSHHPILPYVLSCPWWVHAMFSKENKELREGLDKFWCQLRVSKLSSVLQGCINTKCWGGQEGSEQNWGSRKGRVQQATGLGGGEIGEGRTALQPSAIAPTLVTQISDADMVLSTSAVCLHFELLLSVLMNKLCVKVSDCQPKEHYSIMYL